MSTDLFGLLSLPAAVPATTADAVTDPALNMVLDFMKSVINADLGDAWEAVAPTDPEPVAHVFTHNPDLESFSDNDTPALYAWRGDDNGTFRFSQDYVGDDGTISCLWVPPPADQESRKQREPFRNGLKKSLRAAFAQGRHPAWVLAGDTYYEPEIYGSVLLYHAKFAKLRLGSFRSHTLILESEDRGGPRSTFECLFFTLEALELLVKGTAGLQALDALEGTVSLPARGDRTEPLSILSSGETVGFHVEMEVSAISPANGAAEGGSVHEITGAQFIDGMAVYFGNTEAILVELVDETTLSVTAPPHAAGTVDVRVVQIAGGVEKTLTAAFTFT